MLTLLGLYFYISLILKSDMVSIGKYNPHKRKLWGHFNNF